MTDLIKVQETANYNERSLKTLVRVHHNVSTPILANFGALQL